MSETEAKWSDLFQCAVYQALWRKKDKSGILLMQAGDNCDMNGVIEFYLKHHPDVHFIATFSGNEPDTCYFVTLGGQWKAETPDMEQKKQLRMWRRDASRSRT